ncbi:MAG: MBL fold metallo-hydrolase [Thermodesulfobacteriota bacterium]
MLRKLTVGPYQANCYIIGCDDTGEGVVIDPGDEVFRIVKEISKNNLTIRCILLTHGHFDHTGGAAELQSITKAPVLIHPRDARALNMKTESLSEAQAISVGSYDISVIHTPGHSPGSVCFSAPGAVFSGDALFAGSVGRTDFPGGNYEQLIQGIQKKVFPLGDHIRVYPGHGPSTTIGRERRYNPFFRASKAL